jgi:NADPH:quinone reductase-like Zn-dependent oxidoreductase
MKAVRLYRSGRNPTVSLEDVSVPRPGPGEILVRVHAAAVTPGEFEWYPTWHTPKGDSRVNPVPGHEFSEEIQDADLVLDLVGGDTFQRSFGALKEGGRVAPGNVSTCVRFVATSRG